MFAVIKTGGKQYKVAKNDVLKVEKIADAEAGSVVVFEEVLTVNDGKKTTVGTPTVKNMTVSAEIIEQKKDDKVIVFKKKRRHNYRRKNGHRQQITWIRIQDIAEGLKPKKATAKKEAPKKEEAKAAPKKEESKAAPKKEAPASAKATADKPKKEEAKAEPKKETAAKKAPAKKPAAKKPAAKKETKE